MEAMLSAMHLAGIDADQVLSVYGLPAIFLVMLLKETGVPIPIPSDLIMLGAAARVAAGRFDLGTTVVVFEVAMLIGGLVQYALARGPGRGFVYRVGRYLGLTAPRLDRAGEALRRGGMPAVSLSLMTPGLRAATVAAAGLARLPLAAFVPGLLVGNTVFFLIHVALGYAGGQGLGSLLQGTNLPAGPVLALVLIALLVAGFAGWLVIRRRARPAGGQASLGAVVEAWEEACCPACLALGALGQARELAAPPALGPAR